MTVKRALSLLMLLVSFGATDAQDAPKLHKRLSTTEARILLYLSPAANDVRRTGLDVYMEETTSEAYNQSDYYVFQMFSTRVCEACSANVGFFAVNKHTADVRNLDDFDRDFPIVTSPEMKGVQSILRKAHGMTPRIVKRYRSLPIWVEKRS